MTRRHAPNNKNHRNNNMRKNNNRRHNNGGKPKQNLNANINSLSSTRNKYLERAKDAMASGDRVSAENFYQHADHYSRILEPLLEEKAQNENRQKEQAEARKAEQEKQRAQEEESANESSIPPELALEPKAGEEIADEPENETNSEAVA